VNWRVKSLVCNAVSLLPSPVSYAAHYWLQRHFGSLRRIDPIEDLRAGVETWKRIRSQGHDPSGKVFLEIGTGWVPLVPLSCWLMGAGKTITIDSNPYVKAELIRESLRCIHENSPDIVRLFGDFLVRSRLDDLLAFTREGGFRLRGFLDLCRIDYVAPGDAAVTGLPAESVDYHTSYTVLEHIEPGTLTRILEEGNRIVNAEGLFVHRIDYADHLAYCDRRISPINFLRFSDEVWNRLAGNRYA